VKRAIQNRIRRLRLAVFDFDGVFTDNRVIVDERGRESVRCCRSDGIGLRRLEAAGVEAMILSSEPNPVVRFRARKLGVRCLHDLEDKAAALKRECARRGIAADEVAYVGNDVNDAGCLRLAGLPVVVADAWPEVLRLAAWVLERRGGDGAVREFCDEVARLRSGVRTNGDGEPRMTRMARIRGEGASP
jgi:YrbI family 3-deoxy-D-manno-octulosonate 8-phosphate phosphatase